ncbi:F120B protein, partial [Buphagus erythrorhynchus]|nr:F120B protein [Buphagus erythrorhynchus]
FLSDCCEFWRSAMGVRGLQGFVARVCPDACQTVDLREMAEKHRLDHPDSPPVIVVDAMSCVRHWYTPESWVCGGQWREYLVILQDFINAFMAAGIKLVFYFDGVVEEKKRDEWIKRRMKNTEEIARLFRFIKTHRKQPGREMFVLPSALPTFTRYALKSLGQKTVCTLQEADFEVAAYGLQHNCIGILGQDSDYLIYNTCPYFSIENLRLDRLVTVMYSREVLCHVLGISLTHLPLFACLLGNDIVPESMLEGFWHKCLTTSPHRNNSYNRRANILLSVANYISKIPCSYSSLKHLEEVIPLGSDKTLLCRGVNSYLLPGQQSPWIPPNVTNCQVLSLQQQSALCQDQEIFQVTSFLKLNDHFIAMTIPLFLKCQLGQIMGSSSCRGQQLDTEIAFTSPVTQPQLSQPVFNPFSIQPVFVVRIALTQVQDLVLGPVEIDEVCTGPPLKPVQIPLDGSFPSCMSTAPRSLVSPADLPRQHSIPLSVAKIKQCWSQYRSLRTPLVTGLPLHIEPWITTLSVQPSSQFLIHQELAKEQHIQSENFSIFNILSHGGIECSNSLEDDCDTEIPGQALIYRPARQHIYSILLESGKGKD